MLASPRLPPAIADACLAFSFSLRYASLGIAFTRAMMDPKPTKNHAYKFQRIFTDGDYLAAGVLVIPPNESKPLKPARDNTYVSETRDRAASCWLGC